MIRNEQEDETFTYTVLSQSSEYTQRLGIHLGESLRGGELILLDGQLGTGKTTFTQGLAKGMQIAEIVNSPTFTILKEYQGLSQLSASEHQTALHMTGLALYHFDLYRLDDPEEMVALGFEDYFAGSGVCVVEWADKAAPFWPAERLSIQLHSLDATKRRLLFVATGAHYCELLRRFQKNTYATASS